MFRAERYLPGAGGVNVLTVATPDTKSKKILSYLLSIIYISLIGRSLGLYATVLSDMRGVWRGESSQPDDPIDVDPLLILTVTAT